MDSKFVKTCHEHVISIRRSNEDWILDILHAKTEDEAIYECQVSTEPPKIHKIFLAVEGKNRDIHIEFYKQFKWNLYNFFVWAERAILGSAKTALKFKN